jgi:predicted DNA-binding transcriptional regulator AlpA
MNTILLNGITLQELADAIALSLKPNPQPQPNPQSENDLLTREEVCKLLSINKTTRWKHTKSGKLKSLGIGNLVFYKKSQVLGAVMPLNAD